jgi:transposase
MLTREEDVDAHALSRQGWMISAIARHLGRDRKTIRAYLNGDRVAGERVKAQPDPFEPFVEYVTARLTEDPHLWAVTLFDELQPLGFDRSYPTLTRQIRDRGLRPPCEACRPNKGRPLAVIAHPPGEETQWDWLELPDPPAAWGWGTTAHLLVGALSHSSKWRGALAEAQTFPELVDGLDAVSRRLGGLTRDWRFDRMATVVSPSTGRITAAFAGVAKHYGVRVVLCPPRRGNRKGVVEKANHVAAQRFWRTLPDDITVEQAQAALDEWCRRRGDLRLRLGRVVMRTVRKHLPRRFVSAESEVRASLVGYRPSR